MNNLLFDKEKFTPQPHRAALYQKKYQNICASMTRCAASKRSKEMSGDDL